MSSDLQHLNHLLKIVDILQETPQIFEIWPMVINDLLGGRGGSEQQNGRTMEVWICETLEEWISLKGNEATFDKLNACLRKYESIAVNYENLPSLTCGSGNTVSSVSASTQILLAQVQIKELDKPLSEFDLLRIGDIIQEIPEIYKSWPMIVRELLGSNTGGFYKANGRSLDIWINDTLEEWVTLKGDAATFGRFMDCLRNRKCTHGADLLVKRIKHIKK